MSEPENFSALVHKFGLKVNAQTSAAPQQRHKGGAQSSHEAHEAHEAYETERTKGAGRHGRALSGVDRLAIPASVGKSIPPERNATSPSFRRPHVNQRDWQRLSRGQIAPEQTLDLHGVRFKQGFTMVKRFLDLACANGCCLVRIIHGKGLHSVTGTTTLKSALAQWLPGIDVVLAFYSRPTADGRSGSMDILLKKHTRKSFRSL